MDENEGSGGLSSPKKVVAGAALGVAVPAAVAVAKKLMGGGDGEHDAEVSNEPLSRERKHAAKQQRPRAKARPRARTREELYKQATRLKIEGRSSMNKAQLERAVARAKQKAR